MDYLSPFSCSDHPSCQVFKGCAAGPAFGGSCWVQVGAAGLQLAKGISRTAKQLLAMSMAAVWGGLSSAWLLR